MIKEIKSTWSHCELDFVKEFLLHEESEVKKLPKCCIGSTAIVCETSNVYVCGKDGSWKLREEAMAEGGGSDGGGTGGGVPFNILRFYVTGNIDDNMTDIAYELNGNRITAEEAYNAIKQYRDGAAFLDIRFRVIDENSWEGNDDGFDPNNDNWLRVRFEQSGYFALIADVRYADQTFAIEATVYSDHTVFQHIEWFSGSGA